MNRLQLWMIGAALGFATVLAAALLFLGAVAVASLAIPLARRPGGRSAVSGELTAFGALWLGLIWQQTASGGTVDDAAFWTAVGAVPLVAGLALAIWVVAAGTPRTDAPA